MATGIGAPAPVATSGVPSTAPVTVAPATTAAITAPPAGQQAQAPAGNAAVSTGYDPTPVSGGGIIEDLANNFIAKITAGAQGKMNTLQNEMNAELSANGGTMDPAKLQQYSMKMSQYEMAIQLAAKIQESEDKSREVWLRM